MEILFDSFIGTHYIEEEEKKAALEVLDSKSLFRYDGPHFLNKTGEFEGNLRDFLGCENVLASLRANAATASNGLDRVMRL